MLLGGAHLASGSWERLQPVAARGCASAVSAFDQLSQRFSKLVFDLRMSSFQDFHNSFGSLKASIEELLNQSGDDPKRTITAFNSAAHRANSIASRDNRMFDVRAAISRSGAIELVFVEI